MRNHWRGFSLILIVGGIIATTHAQESNPDAAWQQVEVKGGTLEIHPNVTWKGSLPQGPFVRLGDGGILGINGTNAIVSHDEGETWEPRPLFSQDQNLKVSSERAMVRTAGGA
ncbi:MAG: hypothetical protein KJ060_12615, partial [Candidatus Hydrogenedentes bacterium]|nr:hypothetical protein [Candidatus Hydrogenedentota bacterium]